jgi:hypothetical protein
MVGNPMVTLAIGPRSELSSWKWIGEGLAQGLGDPYRVRTFDAWQGVALPPHADVCILVKGRPGRFAAEILGRRRTKVVYCPVDVYNSAEAIAADAPFLRSCAAVIVHGARMLPLIRPFAARVELVEHHNRFGLVEPAPFRESGPVVWVGGIQNLPYLLAWLERSAPIEELVAVTDLGNRNAVRMAHAVAVEIGLDLRLDLDGATANGVPLVAWTEESQRHWMGAAKAAIDIKGSGFNQRTKPATKAQQFVASGIPLAINADSHSAEYFRNRGFEVAVPEDRRRWFSKEYWQQTATQRERLVRELSLESVCAHWRRHLASIL